MATPRKVPVVADGGQPPTFRQGGLSMPDILKTVQTSDRDRNRNRVRMELSPAKGEWVLGLIAPKIKEMDIDSEDFKEMYDLYNSLRKQLNQIKDANKV